METYKKLKKGTKSGLIISFFLVVFSAVLNVTAMLSHLEHGGHKSPLIHCSINFIMIVFIIVYSAWGYKKPHGNMLKYVMFLFSVGVLSQSIAPTSLQSASLGTLYDCCAGFASLLIAYISGRLNKIEKNKVLMFLAGILLSVSEVILICNMPSFRMTRLSAYLVQPLLWFALGFAYTARYEEHREAGLSEE